MRRKMHLLVEYFTSVVSTYNVSLRPPKGLHKSGKLRYRGFNPLSPRSDQRQISP